MAPTSATTASVQSSSYLWKFCLPIVLFLGLHLFLTMTGLTNRRGGRGGLVTTLMSKMEADRELEQMDRTVWYTVDRTDMAPEVAAKFRQLGEDEETAAFIRHSFEQSDWLFTQLYYNLAKSLLGWFYCQTDINGILGRGSMFVFSKEQILQLTGFPSSPDSCLLDLGAGDGRPTAALAGFFQRTFVTEMSGPMRRLCAARGFTVLELDAWAREPAVYDVISALNLFDRCDKPLSILKDVHYSLKPGGLLVVALVLPFRPYVESVPSHKPSEAMIVSKGTFKQEVETAVAAFAAAGFALERWSRVPYLCEGDLRKPIYQLDNGLFVFRRTEGGGEEQNTEQQMEN